MQLPIPLTADQKRDRYFLHKEKGITTEQFMFIRYYLGADESDYEQNGGVTVHAVFGPESRVIQHYDNRPIMEFEVGHRPPYHQFRPGETDQRDTYVVDTFVQAMQLVAAITSDATVYNVR